MNKPEKPKILAPAGDKYSYLAAIAAGADAVYCGLKNFSARMEAENFSIEELSRLNALARSKNVETYVAFNSLVKQNEIEQASNTIAKLSKYVRPNALIIQDTGLIAIARDAGFKGEFHLSTLGNCSFPLALESAENAGFSRVVLPRELTIDEIKFMAQNKPAGIDLEIFIHGALCYAISGRCYWSSWFGGKSGLRGRCVQPCRRVYKQQIEDRSQNKEMVNHLLNNEQSEHYKEQHNEQRFFSCLDFSADVLVKVLKDIAGVTTWKIEGRKKSPHYVFYTVKAYKMLRDHGHDPSKKKIALSFLNYALGRATTHYNLLTQNPINPLKKDIAAETGSGLFIGRVRYGGEGLKHDIPNIITNEELLTDDLLRIGYEDDAFHLIQRVTRSVPKKGRFILQQRRKTAKQIESKSQTPFNQPNQRANIKNFNFKKGTPVFIVDRREKEVWLLIKELEIEFDKYSSPEIRPQEITNNRNDLNPSSNNYEPNSLNSETEISSTFANKQSSKCKEITLYGYKEEYSTDINNKHNSAHKSDFIGKTNSNSIKHGNSFIEEGLWLFHDSINLCHPKKIKDIWWFLPPVIWPLNENMMNKTLDYVLSAGAKNFVLNMPWQIEFFNKIKLFGRQGENSKIESSNTQHNAIHLNDLKLWAGPFCNVANTEQIKFLKKAGFYGAFISPELSQKDFLALPAKSTLPLGVFINGNWPLAVSRIVSDDILLDKLFQSPKGENAWVSKKEGNYWIFPNWRFDLSDEKALLKNAGYKLFLTINEPIPNGIVMKNRPGLWNWEIALL